jgi:hypothetical protein
LVGLEEHRVLRGLDDVLEAAIPIGEGAKPAGITSFCVYFNPEFIILLKRHILGQDLRKAGNQIIGRVAQKVGW